MNRYLNGELIRIEPGREGSPVSHIVWDSYAGREVRIYPLPPMRHRTDAQIEAAIDADIAETQRSSSDEPAK